MSFKQAIQIDNLKTLAAEIAEHIEALEEYGYCAIHTDAYPDLLARTELLQQQLKTCATTLDQFRSEMTDWFSY